MALPTFSEAKQLVKYLRIDVYFFLFMFTVFLPNVPLNQFVQDKYCIVKYNVSLAVCLDLENAQPEYISIKENVLKSATLIKMLTTTLLTAPGFLFSVILGYWIDSYPGHLRYLLALCPLAYLFQNLVLIYQSVFFEHDPMNVLISYILPALAGGLSIVMTGSYTYATLKTPPEYRTVRFAILELAMLSAYPTSSSIGGAILGMNPWFPGQYRNYIGVFLLGAVTSILASLWVLIFLDDAGHGDIARSSLIVQSKSPSCSVSIDGAEKCTTSKIPLFEDNEGTKLVGIVPNLKTTKQIFCDILNIRNVVNMMQTCCKKRPNNGRAALWNCILMMIVIIVGYIGERDIGFQFAQTVYHWSAEYYSYVSAAVVIIPFVGTIVSPFIFINKLGFHDSALGILGCTSLIAMQVVKGGFLNVAGYYLSVVACLFAGLAPITIRTLISRIIAPDEIGQVYALLSCIESAGPMISTFFYSTIFKATLDNYPGIVYHAAGVLLFYPLIASIWLNLTKHEWDSMLRDEVARNQAQINAIPEDHLKIKVDLPKDKNLHQITTEPTIMIGSSSSSKS